MKPQRNTVAAGLRCGQFQPRIVRPRKGKGAYRRTPKHNGARA